MPTQSSPSKRNKPPSSAQPTSSPKRQKTLHIADTMSSSSSSPPPVPDKTPPRTPPKAPRIPYAQTARTTPNNSKGKGPALPLSTFNSTFTSQRPWNPRCNHVSMIRSYSTTARCAHCHRHGDLGWIYRCSQDLEAFLLDVHEKGTDIAFDELGTMFTSVMSLGKFGPDRRADPYALLKEMTPQQMRTYTPDQIATLLRQREEVRKAATAVTPEQETLRAYTPTRDQVEEGERKPWVVRQGEECRYQICHTCYRGGQDKAVLSLNSVLEGDIPPSAATAWTFRDMGSRPVVDAETVGRAGTRAVPLLCYFPTKTTPSSHSSKWSVMDIINSHLQSENDLSYSPDEPIASSSNIPQSEQRMTEYGPVWWSNSSSSSHDEHQPSGLTPPPRSHQLRQPFQPPPRVDSLRPPPGFHFTPAITHPQPQTNMQTRIDSFFSEVLTDDETAQALINNAEEILVRKLTHTQVELYHFFASKFSDPEEYRDAILDRWLIAKSKSPAESFSNAISGLPYPAVSTESASSSTYTYIDPDAGEEHGDGTLAMAITTSLPQQGTKEELSLQEEKTAMEEAEEEEGVFYDIPLEVSGGVAVTEEGVEEGRADVGF